MTEGVIPQGAEGSRERVVENHCPPLGDARKCLGMLPVLSQSMRKRREPSSASSWHRNRARLGLSLAPCLCDIPMPGLAPGHPQGPLGTSEGSRGDTKGHGRAARMAPGYLSRTGKVAQEKQVTSGMMRQLHTRESTHPWGSGRAGELGWA